MQEVGPVFHVQMQSVDKWFGDLHVLRNINLTVSRGERIVICGPSGSGKSTLIRCINRLEPHQKGRIVVDGVELTNNVKKIDEVRRHVGMVFQQFNLFPHLTILENCTLAPIWVKKMPTREAEDGGDALSRARQDSGAGRTSIPVSSRAASSSGRPSHARCAWRRKIMLFDEPTSALDPEMVKEVLDTMVYPGRRGHDDAVRDARDGVRAAGGRPRRLHGCRRDRRSQRARAFFSDPRHERTGGFSAQILT